MLVLSVHPNISFMLIILGLLLMLIRGQEKLIPFLDCNNRCLGFATIVVGISLLLARIGI